VPGFEAPVNLAYSARNRSAAIRIPTYSPSPKAKRIEFRTPDAAANPYIAFSALLLAGLDGIQNRIDPGDPLDKNLYDLPPEELAQIASVPDSLRGAIEALQADHSFLLRGDVFNADFIANWIDMKQKEYDALRLSRIRTNSRCTTMCNAWCLALLAAASATSSNLKESAVGREERRRSHRIHFDHSARMGPLRRWC